MDDSFEMKCSGCSRIIPAMRFDVTQGGLTIGRKKKAKCSYCGALNEEYDSLWHTIPEELWPSWRTAAVSSEERVDSDAVQKS
jgi:DNA-directed RNA polymerase subunit RPC12/RpoP